MYYSQLLVSQPAEETMRDIRGALVEGATSDPRLRKFADSMEFKGNIYRKP